MLIRPCLFKVRRLGTYAYVHTYPRTKERNEKKVDEKADVLTVIAASQSVSRSYLVLPCRLLKRGGRGRIMQGKKKRKSQPGNLTKEKKPMTVRRGSMGRGRPGLSDVHGKSDSLI